LKIKITKKNKFENSRNYFPDKNIHLSAASTEFLNLGSVITVILDKKGNIQNVNRNIPDGLFESSKTIKDILNPGWLRAQVKFIAKKCKRPASYEGNYIDKKKNARTIVWNSDVLKDKSGAITGMIITGNDITELKKLNQMLKDSEEKYRITFRTASSAIAVFDSSGRIVEYNRAASQLFGYNDKEMLNKKISEVMTRPSFMLARKRMEFVKHKGHSYGGEYQMIKKNGTIIDVIISSTAVIDQSGRFIKAVSVLENITDRKFMDKILNESEEKYRTVFNSFADAVFVSVYSGKGNDVFIAVNRVACERLGYTNEEMLKMSVSDIDASFDKKALEKNGKELLRKKSLVFESLHRTKSGKLIPVEIRSRIFNLNGKATIIVTARDISDRKAAEKYQKEQNMYRELRMQIWKLASNRELTEAALIKGLLSRLGSALECERVSYSLKEPGSLTVVHEWKNSGVRSSAIGLKIGEKFFGPLNLEKQSVIDRDRIIESMPKAVRGAASFLLKHLIGKFTDTPSLLTPCYVNGKWEGVINCTSKSLYGAKDWNSEKKQILTETADIISSGMINRRSEIQIKESEELYRTLINTSPDAVSMLDLSGNLIFVSDRMVKLHGFERANEMIGRSIYDFADTQSYAQLKSEFIKLLKSGDTAGMQYRAVKRNGATFSGEINASIIKNLDGSSKAVISTIRDVTDRLKAIEALRESDEKYRTIINQTGQLIYEFDVRRGIITWDGAVMEICGYTLEEFNKEVSIDIWSGMIHPQDRGRVLAALEKAENECGKFSAEYRFRHKNGRYIEVEDDGVYISDEFGTPCKMLGVMKNISQRKEAEAILRQTVAELTRSNDELEQFAYVASHDLQEPLRMVSSYVQLLKRRYAERLGPDADDFIAYAVDGADRMQGLIKDLLAYSRVGKNKKEMTMVDLNRVMTTVMNNLNAVIMEKKAVIEFAGLPEVYADEPQMIQLMQNLVSNSLKFNDGKKVSCIIVSAKRTGKDYTISVKDNGIGIEREYFEKIFVIFQRLHGKNEYPGTGIGLSICKKIVESYGGRIWLDSEAGKGTVFYFTVPAEKIMGEKDE
jgi:PAS domain S-box-containing protein